MHTALPGMDTCPTSVAVKQAYERIEAAFPGGAQPATVVVQADDVTAPAVQAAIGAAATPAVESRVSAGPDASPPSTVPMPGDGTDAKSVAALRELRDDTSRPRSTAWPARGSTSPA